MKVSQLAILFLFAVGGMQVGAAPKKVKKNDMGNLGKVLYIGDSITHGFGAPSYRWALHKIFVDNGIEYVEIGIEKGNHSGGVGEDASYMGRSFRNLHAAMSSERAYEVSGRKSASNRLDGTSIHDWFQLDKDFEGNDYEKKDARKLDDKPDTCFILLGTNDTLSDYDKQGGIGRHIKEAQKNLLDKKKGDMHHIVNILHQVSPGVKIVLLTIPTWADMKSNNTAKDYEAIVAKYNGAFKKEFKKEKVVDVNSVLVDICNTEMKHKGVSSFFNSRDQLHPNQQGDLLIAGQVAKAMGYAGRSAGLKRKAAADFSSKAADMVERATEKTDVEASGDKLSLKAGKKLVAPWAEGTDASRGFSVEFTMASGDGSAGGWNMEPDVVLSIGNGVHSGKLKLTDGYIRWQDDRVLLPIDMSKNKEAIRVTWCPGNAFQKVPRGFYVWIGDMLIGEALPDDGEKFNGISFENTSKNTESVKSLMMDAEASAPATGNFVKEEAVILMDEGEAK